MCISNLIGIQLKIFQHVWMKENLVICQYRDNVGNKYKSIEIEESMCVSLQLSLLSLLLEEKRRGRITCEISSW